ncbi:hypothetical protein Q1695_009906 [Nippostrongylus brasiliensis]|nr:hypothetical protein Q1695_009906 [Nippostrongylus brasiliensis]
MIETIYKNHSNDVKAGFENGPGECGCSDENGEIFDFCYRLPQNRTVRGMRFSCKHLPILKSLGLLNKNQIPFVAAKIEKPAFVTAFSRNRRHDAHKLIASIRDVFEHQQRIIVYNLGGIVRSEFESYGIVDFREFNLTKFPEYVGSLDEFRWRPLIIAEVLLEYDVVWYMDPSITFTKNNLSHVYELVNCRQYVVDRPPLQSAAERDWRELNTPLESGWDMERWQNDVKECRKSAFLLHQFTGHGIYTATSPSVYKFIPTEYKEIKKTKAKMYEAGFALIVKTLDAIEQILKWEVLCALEADCMAGNHVEGWNCELKDDRYKEPPSCHRYDQSVLNVLLANNRWYDKRYYTSEIVDFFKFQRTHA